MEERPKYECKSLNEITPEQMNEDLKILLDEVHKKHHDAGIPYTGIDDNGKIVRVYPDGREEELISGNQEEPKVLNLIVAKKLNDYLWKNNKELCIYLQQKDELEEFIINRSNSAFTEYQYAVDAGFYYPDEILNQELYIGIENSYSEYVESLFMNNFTEHYNSKKSEPSYPDFLNALVLSCMPVFYDYLGSAYANVMDSLDKDLLKKLRRLLK